AQTGGRSSAPDAARRSSTPALSLRTLFGRSGANRCVLSRASAARVSGVAGGARVQRDPRNTREEENPVEKHRAGISARFPPAHGGVSAFRFYYSAGLRVRVVRASPGFEREGSAASVSGSSRFARAARREGRECQQGSAEGC